MRFPMRFAYVAAASLALLAGCGDGPPTSPEASLRTTAQSQHFVAVLSGDEEVPPNDSRARGNADFALSADGTVLEYRLTTAGLTGITQAHIHLAAAGVNGPFVVFLFGLVPEGVTENGILASGSITDADLIPNPDIGFGGTMAELVAAMRAGGAYVNAHTLELRGGEVRGQIRETGPTVDEGTTF